MVKSSEAVKEKNNRSFKIFEFSIFDIYNHIIINLIEIKRWWWKKEHLKILVYIKIYNKK